MIHYSECRVQCLGRRLAVSEVVGFYRFVKGCARVGEVQRSIDGV